MIREAIAYCTQREISRREPIYSANRFAKLLEDLPLADLTTEYLEQYRFRCVELKLSARKIESSINDLATLYRSATGQVLDPGKRLKMQRPDPDPIPLADIDTLWPHCDKWLQQWVVLTQWTCLRLSDCIGLQLSLG
jgi:integrase